MIGHPWSIRVGLRIPGAYPSLRAIAVEDQPATIFATAGGDADAASLAGTIYVGTKAQRHVW
jgi:hypothetical protein